MFWRRYGSRSCVIWQGGEMDLSGSGKTLHSDSPNNINICFLHFDMWLTVTYKINAYRSRAKSKLGYLPFNVLLWPGIFYWEKKNNIKKRTFYFSIFLSVCTINSCKLPLKKKHTWIQGQIFSWNLGAFQKPLQSSTKENISYNYTIQYI